jgi:hypothetical protein
MDDHTQLEAAESALAEFKRSMRSGHPWVPGVHFIKNPGLELYVQAALEGWAEKHRPAKSVRRTSLVAMFVPKKKG